MGRHTMKTTIEIADDLFRRAQQLARRQKTTLRALTEQGLRLVLSQKQATRSRWTWQPVVVRGGAGPTEEFRDAGWDQIRDEIYRARGA